MSDNAADDDRFATREYATAEFNERSPETRSAAGSDTEPRSGSLEVRCPNCHAPTSVAADTTLTDLTCSACGSHFSLVDQSQATRMAPSLTKLGRFELIERLGVGGFGSVWKARDKELDRTVAIKIPRAGAMTAEEQAQFFREARAAAQLRHPNIVSVHEVGRDGDSVYIVSDFVRGVTLGDWLTGQKLTSREAAELCAKIADALHHAHEQGVVHRDLKPANIMIDGDGQPHLMDFGLARRDAGEVSVTLDGHILGTPAYMSPEQAEGRSHSADRRSDVYSLGVILFQLLTGELPFRGNARMLLHQVIHNEPPSPRTLNSNVSKDLETITLKCLEKEPASRYQSAAELSEELRRYTSGQTILARPVSQSERVVRWVRRNKLIATLGFGVAAALLIGSIVSTYFAIRAKEQAGIALDREHQAETARADAVARKEDAERSRVEESKARQQAEAVTNFLVQAFQSPDPERDGRKITVAEVLDRAESGLADSLREQPLAEAALLTAIGRSKMGLQLNAVPSLSKAKAIREQTLGITHPETLQSISDLAKAFERQDKIAEIQLRKQTYMALRERLGKADRKTWEAALEFAKTNLNNLQTKDAVSVLEETLNIHRNDVRVDELSLWIETVDYLHAAYVKLDRKEEGASLIQQTRQELQERFKSHEPSTIPAMSALALTFLKDGKKRDAMELFEQVLEFQRQSFGPEHPDTLTTLNRIQIVKVNSGEFSLEENAQILEQILDGRRKSLGDDHPDTITSIYNAAWANQEVDVDEAIRLYEELVPRTMNNWGYDPFDLYILGNKLAAAYRRAGRLTEAIELWKRILAAYRDKLNPDDSHIRYAIEALAASYCWAVEDENAIPLYEEALSIRQKQSRPSDSIGFKHGMARAYGNAGRFDCAIPLLEEEVSNNRKLFDTAPEYAIESMYRLARAYEGAGRHDDAGKLHAEILDRIRQNKLIGDDAFLFVPELAESDVIFMMSEASASGREEADIMDIGRNRLWKFNEGSVDSIRGFEVCHENRKAVADLYEKRIAEQQSRATPEEPNTAVLTINFADACYVAERYEDAIECYEKVLPVLKKDWEVDPFNVWLTTTKLTEAYVGADRIRDAHLCLENLRDTFRKSSGKDNLYTKVTEEELAAFLREYASDLQKVPTDSPTNLLATKTDASVPRREDISTTNENKATINSTVTEPSVSQSSSDATADQQVTTSASTGVPVTSLTPETQQIIAGLLAGWFGTPEKVVRFEKLPIDYGDATKDRPAGWKWDLGEKTYAENCARCHGVSGDGAGDGKAAMSPKPRDFRAGVFKWKSSVKSLPPLRHDLLETIRLGIPGTEMASFAGRLSEDQRLAVVEYVRWLAMRGGIEKLLVESSWYDGTSNEELPAEAAGIFERVTHGWKDAELASNVLRPQSEPTEPNRESIERGRKIFNDTKRGPSCSACHGIDGQSSFTYADHWNESNKIPPLARTPFRGGALPEDLFRLARYGREAAGKPSFEFVLNEKDTWDVVNFMLSLHADKEHKVSDIVKIAVPGQPAVQTANNVQATGAYFQGLAIAVKSGPEAVSKLIDAAIANDAKQTPTPLDALVLGELRLLAGQYETAESAIRSAIERDGSKSYFYKSLAWCLLAQGKTEDARQTFEKALKGLTQNQDGTYDLDKADPDQLTAAYFLDLVTEQVYTERFASNAKLNCFPWFYVAQRRDVEGKKDEAINAYERCVELGQGDNPHTVRALAEWRLRKLKETSQSSQ